MELTNNQQKYLNHYNRLIYKAQNRLLEGYIEVHHIIPKCMGGDDSSSNLVKLTPNEHYVAHQLLTKIYPKNHKLIFAVRMMSTTNNIYQGRLNNKLYEWIRVQYSNAKSEHMKGLFVSGERSNKGSNNPMYGKQHSEESKQKMRYPKSAETKLKMSTIRKQLFADGILDISGARHGMYGKKLSPEQKQHLSDIRRGIPKSEEHKRKISEANKGEKNHRYGKSGTFLGKTHSDETKQRMSEIAKARYARQRIHCDIVN